MPLLHYTVSLVRLAAMCPRVHYFDADHTRRHRLKQRRVTQLWKDGGRPAGGALFHRCIEKFNRLAASAPEVSDALRDAEGPSDLHERLARFVNAQCLDLTALKDQPVEFKQGFVTAQHAYLEELANLANYALSNAVPARELRDKLFGDPRKAVDVTFKLHHGEAVRVTGSIDYIYFDWRTGRHRILEYKLTPAEPSAGDVTQVWTYALMHDQQHHTEPDVAVYYLHPKRRVIERSWQDVWDNRHQVYDYLASMVAWERYDEAGAAGTKPPGNPRLCAHCPWNATCEERLGPKSEGVLLRDWQDLAEQGQPAEPKIKVRAVKATAKAQAGGSETREEPTVGEPPPEGLWVGASGNGGRLVVPSSVLNTHVAVVGAAGSGKSWTAKIIAEEAIRNRIPVLAVDPQGDLVQFLRQRDVRELDPELRPAFEEFIRIVEPRVYTPGTSHGIRVCLSPIRMPRPGDLDHIERPERREEEERAILESVAGNLVSLAALGGDAKAQLAFVYQVLCAMPRGAEVTLADVVGAIRVPDSLGLEEQPDDLIKKAEREKLALRLNTYVRGPSAAMFEGGVPLDLDALLTPSEPGRVPLNVIYLNALTSDDQKHFFVASLAAEIYRWMVTRLDASQGKTNLLFYIDEARDYIPAGGKQPPAKQPLIRLFTQGRKYGVGCLLCTQSPRSVDYNVFGNCSSKLIGRLEAAQDVERIREWFKVGSAPAWLDGRKGAAKGSFVARWERGGLDDGEAFTGRQLFSVHEGAWTPDRLEREVARR
ncbi:MAG: DUF853 family protein [Polyangiaceae bacterium]|nr:DUF853 family protein [Polyangiaceae bacterium]